MLGRVRGKANKNPRCEEATDLCELGSKTRKAAEIFHCNSIETGQACTGQAACRKGCSSSLDLGGLGLGFCTNSV